MISRFVRYNILVAVGLLLLQGCTSPLPRQRASLESAVSCCQTFASLPYHPLSVGKALTSKLSATSPAFAFPQGKSYFAAYAIAGAFNGGTVYVAGYGAGFAESDATWFYPAITVLNENFATVGYSDIGVPIHSGNYWHGETMIENRVFNVPASARYVIVHFPDRARNGRIGGSLHQDSSVQIVNGQAVPGGPNNVSTDIPLSPVGEFKIAVLPSGRDSPDDLPRHTFWYHVSGLDRQ